MVAKVYHWSNNMVMVFDQSGKQIEKLQGPYLEVRSTVLEACNNSTRFFRADWGSWREGDSERAILG